MTVKNTQRPLKTLARVTSIKRAPSLSHFLDQQRMVRKVMSWRSPLMIFREPQTEEEKANVLVDSIKIDSKIKETSNL